MLFKMFMRKHYAAIAEAKRQQEAKDFVAKLARQNRERIAIRILKNCGGDADRLAYSYERYEWLADVEKILIRRASRKN